MGTLARVHQDPKIVHAVRDLVIEGFAGAGRPHYEPRKKYEWLGDIGTRIWLDTGNAEAADKVWGPEIEALTTNNTLVNQVVQTGVMDAEIACAAKKIRQVSPRIPDEDLVIELAFVANAKLALSLVERFGAHVSVELHPDTANDVASTLVFARRYYEINPQHFFIKIPLSPDGFVAAKMLSCENIPINFTLGFSARQNYLAALFSGPRYVNVFLGRLNSLVEDNDLGLPVNIGEKAALASYESIRHLRESRTDVFTYQIAASMRNGAQVATLAGVDVITLPPKVAAEYLDSDVPRHHVHRHKSNELQITLNQGRLADAGKLHRLWDIDSHFKAFAEDAVLQSSRIKTGRDLVALSNHHGVGLFHHWDKLDRQAIRDKGKIPDTSAWPGAPIDDLMSVSALEAFAQDQVELDTRIERLVRAS